VPNKQEQEYRATGTGDCSGNCPKTVHETVQNGVLGTRGRRFKSCHPDLQTALLL